MNDRKYDDHETKRQRFWCAVYLKDVDQGGALDHAVISATTALVSFDERFPNPEKENER